MGPGAVGKSALTLQYVQNQFVMDYDPTIEDAYRKTESVDGIPCIVDILDTAGQDEYGALRSTWMQDRDAFVFVFALDNHNSYQELAKFYEQLMSVKEGEGVPLMVVGNKCDLPERKTTREQGVKLAKAWSAGYVETSAKTGDNVQKVFHTLIRRIRKIRTLNQNNENEQESKHRNAPKKNSIWWCSLL
mmetsp:Transcript_8532/g.20964  ORF Transcript_8532/g.20964 Transcript_8532/m.20964 type:complete len:189 (-) Transcript_8532:327-893(-)